MNIIILGTGMVGLTHAVVCAELGHRVVAFDDDEERLAAYRSGEAMQIERYVNEPGLATRIRELRWTRLAFVSSWTDLVQDADAVFICVPLEDNSSADRGSYGTIARKLAEQLAQRRKPRPCVVVNKSTVPVGTARWLSDLLREHRVTDVGVASNPEFLPKGSALETARQPDRVVVGADRPQCFHTLRQVYRRFVDQVRYIETTSESAESLRQMIDTCSPSSLASPETTPGWRSVSEST